MSEIPLIDLDGAGIADGEMADAIVAACRDVGFMYVIGHGIDPQLIDGVRREVASYFSQTLERKLQHRITRDNYRGYIPEGFFSANSGDLDADHYEGFKLHREVAADDPVCAQCDLYGPNRWPESQTALRRQVDNYWSECDRVAEILLRALVTVLDTDVEDFLQLFRQPLTNMTLLHYPPQDVASTNFGIHPHKDTDVLTILAPDPVGGLLVKRRRVAGWIEADPPHDALVVNIGDMLELWSGGYFVSTPHQVVNRNQHARYSFPYFVVPRHDVIIEPLRQRQLGYEQVAMHAGAVSRLIWRANWPDAAPVDERFDPTLLDA